NRMVIVKPLTNQFGSVSIFVIVTDSDGGSVMEDFQLTVNPVNDRPEISAISDLMIEEDTTSPSIPFTVDDVETAADERLLSATSSNQGLVPNGNILLAGNGNNRTIVFTPTSGQVGTTIITISVSDGSLSTNRAFTVLVNGAPTISPIANRSTSEDQ